jgi:hypothetical protein
MSIQTLPTTDPEVARAGQAQMQALLARSVSDKAFRQKLLTDPRAGLAEFTGRDVADIPESLNVRFVENTADATIVLPDFVAPAELSEGQLEAVSGGSIVEAVTAGILLGIAIHELFCDRH